MVHMKHAADTRKPYSGLSRSLVIAIDVGTTFSGVSYAILEPGEIPKIHGVTRFPGQEHVAGNSKIPSVIYYDRNGNIMAAGAEADTSSVTAQAEDDGWIKAELFKLRLRPRTMQLNMNGMRLTPLPRRKTPVHVFGDYLAYLYGCTRSFICDTHANGNSLWNSVESDIQFVLSHPNGWEGPQQTRMRNAAVYGRLVPDTDAGRARIRFVTEGEASLHACVLSGLAGDVLSNPSKHGFLIADAGGGTLDISAYAIKGTSPLAMEEIAPPDCIFAGSVFVSRRAREFLEEKLRHSKYGTPDSVDHITRRFDETTKRLFRDRNELQFIPFGSPLDKDSAVGIRSGQLRLTGNEVANLFEPSVDAAVNCIKRQIEASNGMIRSVFLVGGYAASPWLFGQLQERLAPYKITVSRPDTQTSKAVADGAVGFYCDHHVSARMSKFMYGVEFLRELDPSDPEHALRKEKLCELPSGPKLLPDAFDCILARSVKVKESTVFTRKYCTELTNLSMLSVFEVEIWCYRGGNVVPKWINRGEDEFSTLCVVQADLSLLNGSAEPKVGKNGKKYWTIVFSVEIHFGLTEFKARIKWMDNVSFFLLHLHHLIKIFHLIRDNGPAVIVYNERGHRIEDDDIDVYPEDDTITNGSRSERLRSEPASRSRTPVEAYYPPTGGSSSRRASGVPDVSRMERSSSKGYPPSVAPSQRSAAYSSAQDRHRGSDGERTGSDSDRRKGKDRESQYSRDDKDRGFGGASGSATPVERTRSSVYGAPSISKVPSSNGGGGEMFSSNWQVPPSAAAPPRSPTIDPPHSRSPTINPPHSRTPSIYSGAPPTNHSHHQDFPAVPPSAVDEHRQSHLWDAPPQSGFSDAVPERSGSPYVDRPKSPYTQEQTYSRPRSPFIPEQSLDRPKSAFAHDIVAPPARTSSPFIDRPKSGIEGSFYEKPKSAFGDPHHSVFADDPPPPAMFGDSGPAAEVGRADSLFGHPPASVFDSVTPTADDGWGFQVAKTPSTATIATTKSGKKKKGSAANTAAASPAATPLVSAPASGLASRASPLFGANKSPFGQGVDSFHDEPLHAAPVESSSPAGLWGSKAPSPNKSPFGNAADTFHEEVPVATAVTSNSPFASGGGGGGLWGSKAPSPFEKKDKPLSPLNPASQIHTEAPVTAANEYDWGFNDNQGAGGGGDGWNNAEFAEPQHKEISRVPTPQPEPPVEAPTPVEEVKETAGGKKKKKKGGATPVTPVTPAKSPSQQIKEVAEKEAEAQKAEEAEKAAKAEKDRIAKEEAEEKRLVAELAESDRQAAAATEAKRLADEQAEKDRKAEQEKVAQEKAAKEKEEQEQAAQEKADQEKAAQEKADKEKVDQDKEKAEQEPGSTFGNPTSLFSGGLLSSSSLNPPDKPWLSTDTGGGDDSWGGWGTPVTTSGKKKKGSKTTTPVVTSPPSAFSSGLGGWGPSFGNSLGGDLADKTAASPKPSPKPSPVELSATQTFDFGSSGPNLDFGFGGGEKVASRAPSPAPAAPAELETTPVDLADPQDVVSPAGEGEGDAGPDAEGEEDKADDAGAGATSGKKKKKKKDKSGTGGGDAPAAEPETPVVESPVVPEPEPAAAAGAGGAGGKKKKKKK
ncbi:hypothetical protein CVT25_012858 [Psilocybe cyanescens]|uniref:Uncharacterized protein n=1 Tax=Psilocybe cyanescens TaxID=93625 RepID=A0A409XLW2_PSICY|nr:hypothetical protein CVT25_012858 [Psilocybe cyanescens]